MRSILPRTLLGAYSLGGWDEFNTSVATPKSYTDSYGRHWWYGQSTDGILVISNEIADETNRSKVLGPFTQWDPCANPAGCFSGRAMVDAYSAAHPIAGRLPVVPPPSSSGEWEPIWATTRVADSEKSDLAAGSKVRVYLQFNASRKSDSDTSQTVGTEGTIVGTTPEGFMWRLDRALGETATPDAAAAPALKFGQLIPILPKHIYAIVSRVSPQPPTPTGLPLPAPVASSSGLAVPVLATAAGVGLAFLLAKPAHIEALRRKAGV